MRTVRRFFENLKRVWDYLPIIWRDRDWDWWFLFYLIQYKLKRMEKSHREDSYHVCNLEGANEIHYCVLLLERILKDEYCSYEWDEHYKKWGHLTFTKDGRLLGPENVKTEEDMVENREDFKRIIDKEEHLKKQDEEEFFKTLKKHYLGWWD